MSEDATVDAEHHERSVWAVSNFFAPPVCAVSAFTLAVVALLGNSAVTAGISALVQGGDIFDSRAIYIGWGVATAVQVGIVLLLARRTFDAAGRWEATLGRASVLVSVVALLAAVLMILGAVLSEGDGIY